MKFRVKPKLDWELYGTGPNCGITKSLLETFCQCPQKLLFAYRNRLSPVMETEALQFGNIFHEALDGFYGECGILLQSDGDLRDIGDYGVDWLQEHLRGCEKRDRAKLQKLPGFDEHWEQQTEKMYGLAWVVLKAYIQHWARDFSDFAWEGLEETFAYPLDPEAEGILPRPKILLRGKRDGRYRDRGGRMWLFETKTKGEIDTSLVDRLSYEIQVMLYDFVTGREFGEELAGVTYNMVRRPQLRQGAKEPLAVFLQRVEADMEDRSEHYFHRYEVSISQDERREWLADFKGLIWRLCQWWDGYGHYKDSGACNLFFSKCPFMGYCAGTPATVVNVDKRELVFPELG